MRRALISALHFLIVFVFFTGGIFFTALPYLPRTLEVLIDQLSHHPEACARFGMMLFGAALFLFFIFYALNRHKYLVIRMGAKTSLNAIHQVVESYFEKQFSKKAALKEVRIGSKSQLEFTISFSPMDEAAREELYVKVEEQLVLLLQQRFGYGKPFNVIAIL